ncbi:MAG: response regulator transcription factor [Candidatus Nanopelagicales bacterium]|jgi:DNA-binding NarL/FixJ family response regulator|nr:response regulator transcription factor [Candidatus Nanopelagicales bacterium]
MGDAIRVVILDDHALFHQGLVAWLGANAPTIEVAYSGEDIPAALAAGEGADVVLLDLDLGGNAPPLADLVGQFRAGGCRVLIVSALGSPRVVRQGLAAGALGYMSKREDPESLLTAIRRVASGEGFLTPEMASILAEAPEDVPNLSIQELTALRLYASGMKLDSVARRMNVSPATAKEYLDRVRAKYAQAHRSVRSKSDMHRAAIEDGFLAADPDPTVPGRRD